MKNTELNSIISNFNNGEISAKEAVDKICMFIIKNYPIFGLHKYDEDFRSELILNFLERGEHILSLYNPQAGDFFSFIYSYIKMLTTSKIKKMAKKNISDIFVLEEFKKHVEERQISYSKLNLSLTDMPKAPLAYKKVPAEELRESLKALSNPKIDKKILVLALKASYYLTENQIEKICKIYNLQKRDFYELIQKCKDSIEDRAAKRLKVQERRNYAYYHHKRYKKIIERLENNDDSIENDIQRARLAKKEIRFQKQWNNLNLSFEKGYLNLRPTNKTVADILGICERQVSYYLNCARKEVYNLNNGDFDDFLEIAE